MSDWRIVETYRKDTVHPAGHGYGRKTVAGQWVGERILKPSTVIVHTTSNINKGTKIWNECTFIRDSPDVSCHDVIGKDGTIYVILPVNMVAWHAGVTTPGFTNPHSIGFEIHCSVGEVPTQAQKDALAWRIQSYIKPYGIGDADIDTHRAVALPKGRKQDPAGWSDAEFYAWRSMLFSEPDWQARWGQHYPYFEQSGIAAAWRDTYRQGNGLGQAVSDEFPISGGGVGRAFERGYVVWHPTAGTRVKPW